MLLKTVLIHQNDYRPPKRRKVTLLEFHCDHFKGLHERGLRRPVFHGGGGWRNVVVGHCFWRGVRGPQHPDPHRSQPPAGGIGTSGGKLHEVGSHGFSNENGDDKEHKGKKTIQRRRRRKP